MTTWNGDGSFWAAHDERYDAVLAPLSAHLFAAADLAPTDRVLDVGCGCGPTSRTAARTASVVGVDIDEQMIARARQRSAGIPNLRFEDPVAAFANLRRTGGRLAFLCWQGLAENENWSSTRRWRRT